MISVGFWLDWNGNEADEMQMHQENLEELFNEPIKVVEIRHWTQMKSFDGDILTFDYGGISDGFSSGGIVGAITETVISWCNENPDKIAVIWCTFRPGYYAKDFKENGGIPTNLVFYHWFDRYLAEEKLKDYKDKLVEAK